MTDKKGNKTLFLSVYFILNGYICCQKGSLEDEYAD